MMLQRLLRAISLPFMLLLLTITVNAQNKVISGKITDSKDGSGLPGVSVTVKGSGTGVQTGGDGTFRINVPSDATTLVISSVGFTAQEIDISGKTTADVSLVANNSSLGEVVVVGYGSSRKRDLSTAVVKVTPKDFNKGVNQTADQLLQGKVPGLLITRAGNDPNGVSNVQLRGPGSLLGGAQPFYVIDGVPNADINLIAPDDIASIDVLRDASATAIYGARGANGVIAVTTKRAKSGQTSVSYNGYVGVERISRRVEVLSGSEIKNYLTSIGKSLNPNDIDAGAETDWQDEITQSGLTHNHNLSVTGGTSTAKYIASVNYFKGTGILITTNIDRLTGRLATDYSLFDNKARVNLTLATTTINQRFANARGNQIDAQNNAVFSALRFLPTLAIRDSAGNYRRTPGRFNSYNPVSQLEQRHDTRQANVFLGSARLSLDLLPGLTYDLALSLQRSVASGSVYDEKTSPQGQSTNGQAVRYNNNETQKILETYFTYLKSLGSIDLTATAGYSFQENNYDGFDARMTNLLSDDLGANNLGLSNVPDGFNGVGAGYKNANRLIGLFGRVKLVAFDKYILEGSVRRDGSSRLGANNKWGNFPSISAGWNIINEDFMSGQKLLSDLKIRVGYGTSGENNIPAYLSLQRFSNQGYGNFYYNGAYIAAVGPVAVANPDLKWQRTSVLNLGLDFAFAGNKISGSIDAYQKESKDLLYVYSIPAERFGFGNITANAGSMRNKGIELVLNFVPVRNTTLTWTSGINASYNKNEVLTLGNDQYPAPKPYVRVGFVSGQGLSNEFSQILQEGLPVGSFYLYQYQGHDEFGNQYFTPKDGRKNGKILDGELVSGDDQSLSGQGLPKYIFGWNNTINFGRIDFNFFFRGQGGNKILNSTAMNLDRLGEIQASNVSKEALEITKSTAPGVAISFQPRPSTKYLEDGSFIRLDNVTLGYALPTFTKYIRSSRIYATVQNVFTLTKYSGVDPELNLSGLSPGIDEGIYPKTRTFTLGVNVNF
ncbi:MAG TPA: TonB-dependent receptor [Flavitalea sp.]|nr:TonB-dependent receptor [Flavitalea sp.]